jgi:hypothetical protein
MKTDKPAFTTPEGKDWLIGLLKSEEYIDILFTKADGTERQMRCTLNENKIPADFAPKSTERKKSDEVLPVFDIENQGWRSFRLDSVKNVQFHIGVA